MQQNYTILILEEKNEELAEYMIITLFVPLNKTWKHTFQDSSVFTLDDEQSLVPFMEQLLATDFGGRDCRVSLSVVTSTFQSKRYLRFLEDILRKPASAQKDEALFYLLGDIAIT